MQRVHLIHWKADEVDERCTRLVAAGYSAACEPFSPTLLRSLKENPPDALVIDLSRLPGQGRDVGIHLRKVKGTRHIPLVFVGGDPEKVKRIRELLPDARYTDWSRIGAALDAAIAGATTDPVVPDSVFAPYAGTPLPKKLGIKPDTVVALIDAPDDFEATLGGLPEGVVLRRNLRGSPGLTLWFVTSRKDLEKRLPQMGRRAPNAGLWICWPKRASGVESDLTQNVVRRTGLDAGLMDFKICTVDDTWSGLRFTIPRDR